MSTIQQLIDAVLRQTSIAEFRVLKQGDTATAMWLINRVLDLTPSQAESMAFRLCEHCATLPKHPLT